jgi:hypothetical protein
VVARHHAIVRCGVPQRSRKRFLAPNERTSNSRPNDEIRNNGGGAVAAVRLRSKGRFHKDIRVAAGRQDGRRSCSFGDGFVRSFWTWFVLGHPIAAATDSPHSSSVIISRRVRAG